MGFSQKASETALLNTKHKGTNRIENATEWLAEHMDDVDVDNHLNFMKGRDGKHSKNEENKTAGLKVDSVDKSALKESIKKKGEYSYYHAHNYDG